MIMEHLRPVSRRPLSHVHVIKAHTCMLQTDMKALYRGAWQGATGLLAILADAAKLHLLSAPCWEQACSLAEALMHWTRAAAESELENRSLAGMLAACTWM